MTEPAQDPREALEAVIRRQLANIVKRPHTANECADVIITAVDAYAADEVTAALEIGRRIEQARDGGGQWLSIAFMGHVELTGYVTEITLGGQAAFHVDLPEKLWGGNPMAWEEYAGSALYSRRPVTEESVRKAWEARQERAAHRAEQQALWRAIEARDGDDGNDHEESQF